VTNLIDLKVDADPYYALDTGSLLVQVDLNSIPEKRWAQQEPYYASRRALVQLMQIELPDSVAPAAPAALAPTGSVVRLQAGGRDLVGTVGDAAVTVEGAGGGPQLRFSSGVSALATSTDGMLLAAAVGDTVEVRDIQSGEMFRVLRGGTARIAAVRWDGDGESVHGTTVAGRTLTWRIDRGVGTLNDSDLWIMDAERDDVTGDVFTLARNGTVMRMSGQDGSLQQTWQVPVGIAPRIAVKDSTVLVVAATDGGDDDLRALDVTSGAVSVVPSAGCTTRDVDVSTTGEMALACHEGVGLAESVGAAVEVSPLPDGDFVDTVVWTREGIVAGSTNGGLWGVTRAGEPKRFTGCVGAMQEIAVVPDRDVVFNAGSAVAPNCTHRYEGASTNEVSRQTLLPEADTRSAQAVATSPDGRMMAYGFANGTVAVMEVTTGDPLFTTTVEGGSVRGLAFNDEGSSVFVASRYGQFHMIDISMASKTPQELLATVRTQVDEAVRLGLYERLEGLDEIAASAEAALTD
jgi:WD40 repeat protein